MSLKELTADKHAEAETTPFMKAVFAQAMPEDIWTDYTYQKHAWYSTIETRSQEFGLLDNLPGIKRAELIMEDFKDMDKYNGTVYKLSQTTLDYCKYICELDSAKKVLAHLYTWHLGDMFGGQMIKKIVNAPHRHLEFENARELMTTVRSMLTEDMADEANKAFEWAIKILREYDSQLMEQNSTTS
jgi:heme oxygenase